MKLSLRLHSHSRLLRFNTLLLLFFITFNSETQAVSSAFQPAVQSKKSGPSTALFPGILFADVYKALQKEYDARPYWVATEQETLENPPSPERSILLNSDILAYYGHPESPRMGILGMYPVEEIDRQLGILADEYRQVNGGRNIKKAFYIIYGTVWPQGEIGYIKKNILESYIEYALAHDVLVFLDHQIGRYGVAESLRKMLPYLRYPNVHLALDPEWRTEKPMQEIGGVTGEEINKAQEEMQSYMAEHGIPGERLLVIHQFNWAMVRNRASVRSDFEKVRLVHCADGFGSPALKRRSYRYNAQADNIPVKGFKLFYNMGIPGAGYDEPLLSPKEVMNLEPRPYIVMYQ